MNRKKVRTTDPVKAFSAFLEFLAVGQPLPITECFVPSLSGLNSVSNDIH